MKEIKQYVCCDGSRFDKKNEAERYEAFWKKINDAKVKYLTGTRLEDTTIKHAVENVSTFKKEVLELAAEYIPEYSNWFLECAEGKRHISHAQRIISDYNVKMFSEALFALRCINEDTGIGYEQPYYANHPDEWTEFYEKYLKPEIDKAN